MSDMAYGLWAGTAVNDTSSVVAAGYAYSQAAGDFATMVKLTRTLSIIPVVIIFSIINIRLKKKELAANVELEEGVTKKKVNYAKIIPWFIVGFLIMALLNSINFIPKNVSLGLKDISKFLMVASLAAIGLSTDFKDMKKSGVRPMMHGFVISLLVVVVALLVEICMGLV